jgi:hypothetical protein
LKKIINNIYKNIREDAMLRKKMFLIVLVLLFTSSIAIFTGCSKPPAQEITRAEKAVDEARQKEADIYVPDIFKNAEESLKKAKELVVNKSYKEAKKVAEETVLIAQKAIVLVETNKIKMMANTEQTLQDVQKDIDDFKSSAAKAIRKKTLTDREEIQGMIGKWEIDMLNIKDKLQKQKVKQAYDDINTVKEQVNNRKVAIEGKTSSRVKKN